MALKGYISPKADLPAQSERGQAPAKAATTTETGAELGETSAREQRPLGASTAAVIEVNDEPVARPSTAEAAPRAPAVSESKSDEVDKDRHSLPYLHVGIDKDEADGKALACFSRKCNADLRGLQTLTHAFYQPLEALLSQAGSEDGIFLLRSRPLENEFILGVMFRGKPTHHLIKGAGEGHFFVNKAKLPAADIEQVRTKRPLASSGTPQHA